MMKLYPVRLLQTAMIAGRPRSPAEGIQMVSEAERARLIENNQAEEADADVDDVDDPGDGLDKMTVPNLRDLAEKEGVTIEDGAKKAAIVAAIRAKRDAAGTEA
jgi:hypothetical protein